MVYWGVSTRTLCAFPSPNSEVREPEPEEWEPELELLEEPWLLEPWLLEPWLLDPWLLELSKDCCWLEAWRSRASCTEMAMEGRRAAIIWATRRSVLTLEEAEKALEASSDWLNWLEEEEEEEEDELVWLALLLACCWARARAAWLCAAARVACSLAARARLTAWVMEGVSTPMI